MQPAEVEPPKYQCHGDDREDLTEKVKVAAALKTNKVVFFSRLKSRVASAPAAPVEVLVICDKGHKNVFRVRP